MPSRTPLLRFALLGTFLLAFALRVYRLDQQSLWYDEGVTATIAQLDLVALTAWTAADIQPPLYYYVIAGWGRIAGWSEWSLRFPSVFFGALTIPLLVALTRRLIHRPTGSSLFLAALFSATHPLLIYYSQEARMYALLTALGVLLGYLLLRNTQAATSTHPASYALHLAYIVTATAAIYTHYFAFFLLLAFGLWFLFRNRTLTRYSNKPPNPSPSHPQLPIHRLAQMHLLIGLLYLPWFAVMFTRLAVDTSYWQGQLKIWEALRKIAITFTSGETIRETTATQFLMVYALITLISVFSIFRQRRAFPIHNPQFTIHNLFFPLLWLTVPIAATLALAAFAPKFNARYVMIALPGLIVLWSWGLGTSAFKLGIYDFGLAFVQHVTPQLSHHVYRALRIIYLGCTGLLLAGFAYANIGWFSDPGFTKTQWREFSRYLRERIEPGEQVILVSGHAWPVWSYYAPDMPAARLPDLRILDVDAVLDYANSVPLLRAAVADRTAARLVLWQDEVVDPMGVVSLHLAQIGEFVPHGTEFWRLDFEHYKNLDVEKLTTSLPNATSIQANFGNQIVLREYAVSPSGALLLLWQIHNGSSSIAPDLQLALDTATADRVAYERLLGTRPAGYLYPTERWRPEQLLVGRIPAHEWAGPDAVPGLYQVALTVYDPAGDLAGLDVIGAGGQPVGKVVTLSVALTQPPLAQPALTTDDAVPLESGLFVRAQPTTENAESGQPFALQLWWTVTEAPTPDLDLFIGWRKRDEPTLLWHSTQPVAPDYPLSAWPPGVVLHTVHPLTAPDAATLPPGDYAIEIGLAPSGATQAESSVIDVPFTITPSSRSFELPEVAHAIDALFSGQIQLHGLRNALPDQVAASTSLELALVWRAETVPNTDYSVTAQWLDAQGKPIRQIDDQLPQRASTWLPQQVLIQPVTMMTPDTPGLYRLIVALYDAEQPTFPRLITSTGSDFVEIGQVHVEDAAERP